ncbi:MAG: hypothetical protein ACRD1K_14600 [Acidimicrobiales bacterium]
MSETENRLEDVEKEISAEDAALEEARRRRRETLGISRGVGGVLGTYASGSVAMGVVNDPVEDADGGIILDRRQYPSLGPDGGGDTPSDIVAELHDLVGPAIREIWPKATVHDMKRGITVRMRDPLFSGADPYVDVVVAMNRKGAPGLWIPNLATNCWDASHPQCHVELMLAGNRALRRTRARVVRLAKAWNKQHADPALSSFNIVALALECITTSMPIDQALLVFFDHAASSLAIRRTEDPAGVSGQIKLEGTKDVAIARLAAARDHLAAAIDASDDLDVVATELHKVFWNFLPEPPGSTSKAGLADLMRQGSPRIRTTASGLAVAGAVTPKRSFGGPRD